MLTYLLAGLFVGAIIGGIVYWAKKENEATKQMMADLTEEQKALLEDVQIADYDSKKFTWTQRAMIARVKENGNSVALKILWYNTVIQNNTLNQCQHADLKMKASEFAKRGLKQGDFVNLFIDPQNAKCKIVD